MIRIDKMYEGYYVGESTPPSTSTDYRCPEILPADVLAQELLKRGARQEDIDAAFADADRHWIPLPPR